MGAVIAGAAVLVSEAGSRPEAALGIGPRGIFGPLRFFGEHVELWHEFVLRANRGRARPVDDETGAARRKWPGSVWAA